MEERWVRCTSAEWSDERSIWVNVARATVLRRDEDQSLTVVVFDGDNKYRIRETPEALMGKADAEIS